MNRFEYCAPDLHPNEVYLIQERNVRLYDGDHKTKFEGGEIHVTTHRIFWCMPGQYHNNDICLAIPINLISQVVEESPSAFSFSRNRKLVLYLLEPNPNRNEGPQLSSNYNHIKLSFREGFAPQVLDFINESIDRKRWQTDVQQNQQATTSRPPIKLRTGIVGIERGLQEKQKATDESITVAFQDLSKLMIMAKDMVQISRNISNKIREKQGDITEDETVRFKSYLLSLGIEDPVTRDAFKSNNQYYRSLAKQISDILEEPITEQGGMMVLTEAYCRINRARGLELVSPEDVLNASKVMDNLELSLKLHVFESGVYVLQLKSLNSKQLALDTEELITEKGSITSEELAQTLGISVVLAKERLQTTEKFGMCCRDNSMEGLRFYPNLFLREE